MDALPHAAKKITKPFFSQQGRVAGSCSICFPPGHPQDLPCRDFFPFFSPSRRCCAYFVLGCAGRGATRDGAASPGSARDARSPPPVPLRSAKQRGERETRRGGTAGVQLLVFSSFSVCWWQERRVISPVQSALHLK